MVEEFERARRRKARQKADRVWLERCYRLQPHLFPRDFNMLCIVRSRLLRLLESPLIGKPGAVDVLEAELEGLLTQLEELAFGVRKGGPA